MRTPPSPPSPRGSSRPGTCFASKARVRQLRGAGGWGGGCYNVQREKHGNEGGVLPAEQTPRERLSLKEKGLLTSCSRESGSRGSCACRPGRERLGRLPAVSALRTRFTGQGHTCQLHLRAAEWVSPTCDCRAVNWDCLFPSPLPVGGAGTFGSRNTSQGAALGRPVFEEVRQGLRAGGPSPTPGEEEVRVHVHRGDLAGQGEETGCRDRPCQAWIADF